MQEQFLVPDHTIKDISGASFAGFYYICFQKSTATIEGFYYHRSSEWYVFNLTRRDLDDPVVGGTVLTERINIY